MLPLRDAFAALFFFAFGLSIDPGDWSAWPGPIARGGVSLVLNLVGRQSRPRLNGFDRRAAANIGAHRAGPRRVLPDPRDPGRWRAGLDAGSHRSSALYVLVLAILGPLIASRSEPIARLLPDWGRKAEKRELVS